ncbi:hypothetical protein FB451DRAFT_1206057 [Mycena latifolia]|nr:hypothetical protein FB451DRAFT_1206057 [Mycena latifolia]
MRFTFSTASALFLIAFYASGTAAQATARDEAPAELYKVLKYSAALLGCLFIRWFARTTTTRTTASPSSSTNLALGADARRSAAASRASTLTT